MSRILIKTSNRTPLISSSLNTSKKILATGELGYTYTAGDSAGGDRLFVGAGGNTNGIANEVHIVGGKYYTDLMDQPKGQTVPQHAVITDANNKVSEFHVDNIDIDGNTISTETGSLILNPTNGIISADTSQIKNVVDPTDPQDAVTLNYFDTYDVAFVSADVNQDGTGNVTTGGSIQVRGTWNTNTKRIDQPNDGVKVEIALDSDVLGLSSLTVDNVKVDGNTISTTSGDLTIDPNPIGNAGKVIIAGDLQVDGTTTTVNSTTLSVEDKNINLASGATNRTEADSAGIHVSGANANIFYDAPTHSWNFDIDVFAPNLTVESDLTVTGGLNVQGGLTGQYQGFDSDFNAKSTDDLSEGSNLYYTDTRVRNAISLVDSSELGKLSYNSTTGGFLYSGVTQDSVRSLFSGSGDITYNSTTGDFSLDVEQIYTKANFDSDLGLANTDQLPEGSTNLYYTTARSDSDFDIRLATKTTTDVAEGTNLYFTDERVDDRISALISEGQGIDVAYNDVGNVFSISVEEATATNLGGAKFDSVDFLVTAGMVELATIDCGTY